MINIINLKLYKKTHVRIKYPNLSCHAAKPTNQSTNQSTNQNLMNSFSITFFVKKNIRLSFTKVEVQKWILSFEKAVENCTWSLGRLHAALRQQVFQPRSRQCNVSISLTWTIKIYHSSATPQVVSNTLLFQQLLEARFYFFLLHIASNSTFPDDWKNYGRYILAFTCTSTLNSIREGPEYYRVYFSDTR